MDKVIQKIQDMDSECFACLKHFNYGDDCWMHPVYPGEIVCKPCYDKIKETFKFMLNYGK